jgi:hypothetical protein
MVVQSISWGGAGHGLVASTAHRVATQAGTPGSARTPRPRPRAPHAGGDVQRERAPAAASAGPAPMAGRGRGRGHCGGRIPGVRAAQRIQRRHGCAPAARVGSTLPLPRSRRACRSARPKSSWARARGPCSGGRTPARLPHVLAARLGPPLCAALAPPQPPAAGGLRSGRAFARLGCPPTRRPRRLRHRPRVGRRRRVCPPPADRARSASSGRPTLTGALP